MLEGELGKVLDFFFPPEFKHIFFQDSFFVLLAVCQLSFRMARASSSKKYSVECLVSGSVKNCAVEDCSVDNCSVDKCSLKIFWVSFIKERASCDSTFSRFLLRRAIF